MTPRARRTNRGGQCAAAMCSRQVQRHRPAVLARRRARSHHRVPRLAPRRPAAVELACRGSSHQPRGLKDRTPAEIVIQIADRPRIQESQPSLSFQVTNVGISQPQYMRAQGSASHRSTFTNARVMLTRYSLWLCPSHGRPVAGTVSKCPRRQIVLSLDALNPSKHSSSRTSSPKGGKLD